jgi:YD repeat-containing protein
MNKIFLITALISALFFSACKKSNNTSTGLQKCRMLQSLSATDNEYFFYDNNSNLVKALYISGSDTEQDNYHYENGHVAYYIRLFKGTLGDTIKYTYESGRYTWVDEYGFRIKYTYNSAGQIIKIEDINGVQHLNYSEYAYNLQGNCIRCTDYSWSGSAYMATAITDFEFGDQKNQFQTMGYPPQNGGGQTTAWFFSPNNITKIRIHNLDDPFKVVILYQYNSFNENGYPLQILLSDTLGHNLSTQNLQYLCP